MERNSEPRQSTPYPAGGEDRGAGGKLRKRPARRAVPATPYARPQQSLAQRARPWLSKLANLVLPSYFSQSGSSANALPAPPAAERRGEEEEEEEEEDHGESGNQVEENAGRDESSLSFNHLVSGSTELGGTNQVTNESKSRPETERVEPQHTVNNSDLDGVSEIEKLLQNKKFSRDEVNRLIEIIHSRASNSPYKEQEKQHSGMFERDAGPSAFLEDSLRRRETEKKYTSSITQSIIQRTPWAETSRRSTEVKHEDINRAAWGGSTPLIQPTVEDEVGASPIQIAKAYMQKRTSDSGFGSEDATAKDEGLSSRGDELALQPFTPSSSIRPSACWPGARVRDQSEYATPLSQRGRFGLQSFSRTPYSRTIASKSKSKPIQLQGNNERSLNMPSSPFQQSQSSTYGLFSSRGKKLDVGEGSVGPMRRTRRQGAVELSARGSPFLRSSVDTPKVENFNVPDGIFSAWKKDSEEGTPYSKASTPTVPSHSSQIARKILEHLDRNPATPKQKSDELRLATSWKKPESSSDITAFTPLKHNSLPQFGVLDSLGKSYQADNKKKSVNWGEDRGKSLFKDPQETTSDVNGKSSAPGITIGSNVVDPGPSQVISKNVDSQLLKANEVPNLQRKPPAHSSGTRPVLSSIAIEKREHKWASSDGSSGFSFQVPASSTGVFSDPPTPSMPSSFSNGLHQPEAGEQSTPTYSFGSSKGTTPALVFSFPSTSTSSSSPLPDGTSDLTFKFGSDKSSRVSFSSIGKDSVCY